MRRLALSCLALLALLAGPTLASAAIAATATPQMLTHLSDPQIKESSGLETSINFPGVLYTHNDSGDSARFFAVGTDGQTKAIFTLVGAGSQDWEDIAAGPNDTLWLGDIGDNFTRKDHVSVYRVHEPTRLVNSDLAWTQYDFRYDDGKPHNAEALLVNPVTGQVYVATKQKTGAAVYAAPSTLSESGYNTLRRVASAPAIVTGGDFRRNGQRLVLRTYAKAYLYSDVGGPARVVDLPSSGESIAFVPGEAALLVGKEGTDSPVWRVPTL